MTAYFDEDEPGYKHFSIPAIQRHRAGLKLAPGGTGLGKTSGICETILYPDFSQQKSIYLANLKQLVEEVGHYPYSLILRSDRDTVFETLHERKQEVYELFQDEEHFRAPLLQWNSRHKNLKVDLTKVKRALQVFEDTLAEGHRSIPAALEDKMNDHARTIMRCFQAAVLGVKTKRGNNRAYLYLLDHPIIQALFPFIAFKRRPEIRLIALTVQKAYYGFFDGSKKLNIARLVGEDGGYTIYLDEFDYLEQTLAHLICESAQITNPFHFIHLFYHVMETHKLPYGRYPSSEELRDKLLDIRRVIKDLQVETGLEYPTIYQFTGTLFENEQGTGRKNQSSHVIFRTQNIVRTAPQYIRQTDCSFELYTDSSTKMSDQDDEEAHQALSALRLFNAVSQATELVIQFFRELRYSNDELVYQEIMRHCFQNTIYPDELERITQYIVPHEVEDGTDLGALLERGYSLYDMHDPQQISDEEEIEVYHYGMYVTPEVLLRSLTTDNLVFGLSATADIPRFVHHFHLDWVHHHMEVHQATPKDISLLQVLNQKKAQSRNNQISLSVLTPLNAADTNQHAIAQYIRQIAKDEDFGIDPTGHLKKRVELFFAVLLHLCCSSSSQEQNKQNAETPETTLLFFNTFRQIHLLFERYPQSESGIFAITRHSQHKDLNAFAIEFQGKSFLVAFYNARQGNKMRQRVEIQQQFDALFWEGKPVVVVTQYKSAGIGINLHYFASPESKDRQDFTRIGLLEAPYYYFGNPLDEDLTEAERAACMKENIWYLGKLFSGKLFTGAQFRQMLTTLHDSSHWNSIYHHHVRTRHDAHLNSMSALIQALGRGERSWEQMPDQEVLVSSDVYQDFQRFCSPEFDDLREKRDAFLSGNLRQILQQVSDALPHHQREARQLKDSRLAASNKLCQEALEPLLARLEKIRQGANDPEGRQLWQDIRQAVLKHDYTTPVLKHFACVAESSYYQQGMLLLTSDNEILPPHMLLADTHSWEMNRLYRVIKDHPVIQEYFQNSAVQITPFPFDPSIRFIDVPRLPCLSASFAPQLLCKKWSEPRFPLAVPSHE
jgi:hypothetical protein